MHSGPPALTFSKRWNHSAMDKKAIKKVVLALWFLALISYGYRSYAIVEKSNDMLAVADSADQFMALDLRYLGFDRDDVEAAFAALGDEALMKYMELETDEDIYYPIAYAFLMCMSMIVFSRNMGVPKALISAFCVFPVLAMLADFYENYHIVQMILTHWAVQDVDLANASLGNTIKWISVTLSLGFIAFLLAFKLFKKLKSKSIR